MSRSLLILDRDGTINLDSDDYIKTLDEWIPIPSSIETIARPSRAGWAVAVATSQSGIVRGYYNLVVFEAMHARLRELVTERGGEVGLIVYCPHEPDDGCECRKPKPGMLRQIGGHYGVDLSGIWFVGGSAGDLEAAWAVDCQSVLVETGKGVHALGKPLPEGTLVFDDLVAVASALLQ